MNLYKAIELLDYHNRWLNGDITCIDELNISDLLKAIEVVIKTINQTNKRKK